MPPKSLRRRQESDSEEETEEVEIKERIEDLKFIQKLRVKPSGVDASMLASGELAVVQKTVDDPWKIRTGGLVDMKRIKTQQKSTNDITNMSSNFARETNQRDEDAEMQKFIEEQLRLKKGETKSSQNDTTENKIKRPEDALFDLPKHLIVNQSKHKSEETLSEQMLSGIPEVDLGVDERIRNVEETEKAKQRLVAGLGEKQKHDNAPYAPYNMSVNFVQHKRYDDTLINPDRMIKPKTKKSAAAANSTGEKHVAEGGESVVAIDKEDASKSSKTHQPVVGDAKKHELLQKNNNDSKRNKDLKRPHGATDEYYLERFKKNMRFSRNSKIKIPH